MFDIKLRSCVENRCSAHCDDDDKASNLRHTIVMKYRRFFISIAGCCKSTEQASRSRWRYHLERPVAAYTRCGRGEARINWDVHRNASIIPDDVSLFIAQCHKFYYYAIRLHVDCDGSLATNGRTMRSATTEWLTFTQPRYLPKCARLS